MEVVLAKGDLSVRQHSCTRLLPSHPITCEESALVEGRVRHFIFSSIPAGAYGFLSGQIVLSSSDAGF